jgi:hypothetical protein
MMLGALQRAEKYATVVTRKLLRMAIDIRGPNWSINVYSGKILVKWRGARTTIVEWKLM